MKIVVAAFVCLFALSACATDQSTLNPPPKVVNVPVPVKCTPSIPPEPAYPDTHNALVSAPNIFEQIKMLLAGRLMRIQREAELQAALDACKG